MKLVFSLFALMIAAPTFASTQIATLNFDKTYYVAGNKAVLTALLASKPNDPNLEFDIVGKLNGTTLDATRVTDYDFYSTTAALTAGSYNWTVTVYLQDARYARDLKTSITGFTSQIAAIDVSLQTETNPTVIAQLQAQRASLVDLGNTTTAQLAASRTSVYSTYLTFIVH